MHDEDRAAGRDLVEVPGDEALTREVDGVEPPGEERLGRAGVVGHHRFRLAEPIDDVLEGPAGGPHSPVGATPVEVAAVGVEPHAAGHCVAVRLDESGQQREPFERAVDDGAVDGKEFLCRSDGEYALVADGDRLGGGSGGIERVNGGGRVDGGRRRGHRGNLLSGEVWQGFHSRTKCPVRGSGVGVRSPSPKRGGGPYQR